EYRLKTMSETVTAMQLYRPDFYPGPVTLFRARGGDAAINVDPLGGWGRTARGGVEVHDFTCDHMERVVEPHSRNLSAAVQDCLERAQRRFGEAELPAEAAGAPTPSST